MSIIKKILFISSIISITYYTQTFAEDLKKVGKFKDWEVMVMSETSGKVCFAQSIPVLQAPKKNKRDAQVQLGPTYNSEEILSLLKKYKLKFTKPKKISKLD